MSTSLTTPFTRAGIPLDLAAGPLRDIQRDIFQLDVAADRVRLWSGDARNVVDVLSVDGSLRQLVLLVHEPVRPYEDRVRIRGGRVTRAQVEEFVRESGGGRVLRPRGSSWLVERNTDPAERRFLVGFDQDHLFAAQIRSGATVGEAHEALKPDAVKAAEARGAGAIVRQGEWFFVPATPGEEAEIRDHLGTSFHPRRRGPLPGGGWPHWAEELVELPGVRDPESGARGVRFFVRGRVLHRDHATVCFDRWRSVHLNTALRRRTERARGFSWID
jgi:hypothetical protein